MAKFVQVPTTLHGRIILNADKVRWAMKVGEKTRVYFESVTNDDSYVDLTIDIEAFGELVGYNF